LSLVYFFFQAEDGIRDDLVTGVQTCALPILKIDKSFVDKIILGKEGAAVARAIITMSDTLQLETIAEGIESFSQRTELQNLGCEIGRASCRERVEDVEVGR